MSPSLSSKSAANTLRLICLREGSLDTDLDDLATTVDASEVYDTKEMGRLTSPLFSQEREVSAVASSVSCPQTHSSVEKSRRDVEPFHASGNRSRGVKEIEIWRVCKILKWKGKEFCPNKEK